MLETDQSTGAFFGLASAMLQRATASHPLSLGKALNATSKCCVPISIGG